MTDKPTQLMSLDGSKTAYPAARL